MTQERPLILLTPRPIDHDSDEFAEIRAWPFQGDAAFVTRLLENDIPQRTVFGDCRIWIYREQTDAIVGFGTLDICEDYSQFVGAEPHPYIPLLAVNPLLAGNGYGSAILEHLIAEAAILTRAGRCHTDLFLDVYTTSIPAIGLYGKFGFVHVTEAPRKDPDDGNREYHVMVKRTSVAGG